jgi:hypothetical protein
MHDRLAALDSLLPESNSEDAEETCVMRSVTASSLLSPLTVASRSRPSWTLVL